MNIVIGKFGRSIKFNTKNHGAVGGDNEPPQLYTTLARLNPQNTYYMIGKSDLSRLKDVEVPGNIIDVWRDYDAKKHDSYTWIADYFDTLNINIDCGIIMNGLGGESQDGLLSKQKYPQPAKFLSMTKEGKAPLVYYLNKSNIPWIAISNDPRYSKLGRDVFNRPRKVLSQYDWQVKESILKSMDVEDQNPRRWQTTRWNEEYAGMEKIFLLDKPKPELKEKTTQFMMVLNEGKGRYNELERYVLKYFKDVEIYGKWLHKQAQPNVDARFKGSMKFEQLQSKIPHVKYTFIIPIDKGWCTSKVWEMAYHGVIPFMHPTYDEQMHIAVPDFIRVKSPLDLQNKINQLEQEPELYEVMVSRLRDIITEEDLNGIKINQTINDAISSIL